MESADNFNILLKSAIPLLANDETPKFTKKRKCLKAVLNLKYREKLLGFF